MNDRHKLHTIFRTNSENVYLISKSNNEISFWVTVVAQLLRKQTFAVCYMLKTITTNLNSSKNQLDYWNIMYDQHIDAGGFMSILKHISP
jgi:hypothetical protein